MLTFGQLTEETAVICRRFVHLCDDEQSNAMQPHHARLDYVAHSLAIRACCSTNDVDRVQSIDRKLQIHQHSGSLPIALQTTLIDFYGNHGALERAAN